MERGATKPDGTAPVLRALCVCSCPGSEGDPAVDLSSKPLVCDLACSSRETI